MFTELDSDNLKAIVDEGKTVVVQYSAGWCGNCRMMKPKFKRMAEEYADLEFVMVDAEKYPNSRQLAKVDNLPTFAAFKGGTLAGQIQTNQADQLKSFIDETAVN
ncbi:MAG: thiol reductase thioredoxin [Verrucomicrobia bacterium]|nr:thiol reductase thioredoxin [Verrucomicrobiota bacterium]|tara:strand:+ start:402 stop:716 length:315 start_codon:yes stop_codon:yes gene_type:complete